MPKNRIASTSLLILLFFSGFAALVYQVLWVRELGLLFGSTAQAAALTIAIFFTGLASGGWFWGRRAPHTSSLRWFGWVEIGVALTALGHFALVDVYHALYPIFYATVGHSPILDTLVKAIIAATLLLPASFLMGGTLPLMVQHLVRHPNQLATVGTQLYAVNTAGSASGALATGFVLPLLLGFRNTYLLAVSLDFTVGLLAVLLASTKTEKSSISSDLQQKFNSDTKIPNRSPHLSLPNPLVWATAFSSGFATLGIEVIWTRLFSQVLQNSVYTYALVLSTFLLALSLGAAIANALSRLHRPAPPLILCGLLLLASSATAVSPWLFYEVTDGFTYLGRDLNWESYLSAIASVAGLVMLLPGMILGAVLPYLMRILETDPRQPSEQVGRLIAADTTGAILGSLSAGFLLLPLLGAWRSLLLLASIYLVIVAAIALLRTTIIRLVVAGVLVTAAVLLTGMNLQALQTVPIGTRANDRIVEIQEGSHATVAVVDTSRGGRAIRVNTYYTLGSSRNLHFEQNQTVVPMMTHPKPDSVFYLGMGTGITAGAALAFPVKLVVCELLPEVVSLSKAHFTPWTRGLFEDERVTVHAEDGRNCLSRSRDRYNLIISDLFTPWERGTGNLYTLENYQIAKERLEPDGIFVQWIPLYQVSQQEFGIIARTMAEVFPQVVMWRGDLAPSRSIVALIGQKQAQPLDPQVIARHGRYLMNQLEAIATPTSDEALTALLLRLYVGNITASKLFDNYPINTDDYPLIEYLAPRTHRQVQTGTARFLVGSEREHLYHQIRSAVNPEADPYLVNLTSAQYGYVNAGHNYSRYAQLSAQGSKQQARPYLEKFQVLSPSDELQDLSPASVLLRR
ncbi:fused MFS/spermidine synthase [Gloeocapsopsis sp. IPPAS B-1203]|uniref:fused MFS/spermidine synthase n=1 Tax=Gloeocapsopsis sp. IPPAS B-1203 TaxID=2049454 RepID=UPI000C195198|nr:fused MFS/spermidine synthase [Gloeocapsopsis sp. IPPAS B-1203]PIG92227.1 hypothetical protein CSQ79_16465 [Gloeocapsopsis sp. IPPAS B-1203]